MSYRSFISAMALVCAFSLTGCATPAPSTEAASNESSAEPGVSLPIGDGHYGSRPARGSIYSCQTNFSPNAPGASASGPWLNQGAGVWYPSLKPSVEGEVRWPDATYSSNVSGENRSITTRDVPVASTTGVFPISSSDPAYQYDQNPGQIKPVDATIRLPANPVAAAAPSCLPMGPIGVLVDGVVLFNGLDARGDDAAAHEILDRCAGHPAGSTYHHHAMTSCLSEKTTGNGHSDLVGYAFDGFGIYGPKNVGGASITNADLDECHGHSHEIEWDGITKTIYHYHMTADYPYSLGCFNGTPQSGPNALQPAPGGGGPAGAGPRPR